MLGQRVAGRGKSITEWASRNCTGVVFECQRTGVQAGTPSTPCRRCFRSPEGGCGRWRQMAAGGLAGSLVGGGWLGRGCRGWHRSRRPAGPRRSVRCFRSPEGGCGRWRPMAAGGLAGGLVGGGWLGRGCRGWHRSRCPAGSRRSVRCSRSPEGGCPGRYPFNAVPSLFPIAGGRVRPMAADGGGRPRRGPYWGRLAWAGVSRLASFPMPSWLAALRPLFPIAGGRVWPMAAGGLAGGLIGGG